MKLLIYKEDGIYHVGCSKELYTEMTKEDWHEFPTFDELVDFLREGFTDQPPSRARNADGYQKMRDIGIGSS